jgi:hypothetical protein
VLVTGAIKRRAEKKILKLEKDLAAAKKSKQEAEDMEISFELLSQIESDSEDEKPAKIIKQSSEIIGLDISKDSVSEKTD